MRARLLAALNEALVDAQRDLRDHARDGAATQHFLLGVIDGLKKAKVIVAQN